MYSSLCREAGGHAKQKLREVTSIMDWAQENLLLLSAVYLPGHINLLADYLSRASVEVVSC